MRGNEAAHLGWGALMIMFPPPPHHPFSPPPSTTTPPQLADYDCLVSSILDFGLENPVIFNCQVGPAFLSLGGGGVALMWGTASSP